MTARIFVNGNVATAPLVRVTRNGRKVANFRVATTDRYQDKESGTWVDGHSFFASVACWGQLADNVEQSIRIGMPVLVNGKITQHSYTDAEQKVVTAYEIQADSVAPDLSRGTAVFTRVSRTNGPPVGLAEDGGVAVGLADDPWENGDGPVQEREERDSAELVGAPF